MLICSPEIAYQSAGVGMKVPITAPPTPDTCPNLR